MNRYCFILFFLTFSISSYANLNFNKDFSLRPIETEELRQVVSQNIFMQDGWPETIKIDSKKMSLKYSFDWGLEDYVKSELRRYGSDYASVVIIDNNTGKVLTAVDYTKESREFGKNLTFSATNPAASVFKIITAAELLENADLLGDAEFFYNGRATTLYKYQLKDKKTKWTRKTSFERAFARSNNVVFGKAARKYTDYNKMKKMAYKFGFQSDLLQLLDIGDSKLLTGDDAYSLAELASGFNRKTLISPLHGAIIASIAANDGIFKVPYVIEEIEDNENGRVIWEYSKNEKRVLSEEASKKIQELMESTVKKGTARSAFRAHKIRKIKDIHIGGKTGTITGGFPYGRRDWFVSYAMPGKDSDKGISVCVMIVNVKKWYVKSSVLAKNIIEYYYSKHLNN